MDRVSSVMIRCSLTWLVLGFLLGSFMLLDRSLPGRWRLWFTPGHVHMLVVGWFLQFALGVAIWLFPRKRTERQPFGYDERTVLFAAILLNTGLLIRIVFEALERGGHTFAVSTAALAVASVTQTIGVCLFAWGLWTRAAPRQRRTVLTQTGE